MLGVELKARYCRSSARPDRKRSDFPIPTSLPASLDGSPVAPLVFTAKAANQRVVIPRK
jgi:hypothetical protein